MVPRSTRARATWNLLTRAIAHLETASLSVEPPSPHDTGAHEGADLTIRFGGGRFVYSVKVRHRVTTESALALPHAREVRDPSWSFLTSRRSRGRAAWSVNGQWNRLSARVGGGELQVGVRRAVFGTPGAVLLKRVSPV